MYANQAPSRLQSHAPIPSCAFVTRRASLPSGRIRNSWRFLLSRLDVNPIAPIPAAMPRGCQRAPVSSSPSVYVSWRVVRPSAETRYKSVRRCQSGNWSFDTSYTIHAPSGDSSAPPRFARRKMSAYSMGRGVCAAPGATTSTSPNHNVAKRFISLTNREGQRESGTRCRDRQGLPVSALPCHFPAVFPREGSSHATLYAHGQRASLHRLRRRRHAAALGAARQHRPHGHEVRMRHRAVRRLHRPPERRGHALLRDTDRRGRHRESHDHRRALPRWRRHGGAPRAKGVDRRRRAAVRVLPVGAGHGGRGAAGEDARAHRRADRRRHDQHLSLRHLPAHSRRRAPRGEGGLMERRAFLQTAGTVGAGLVIGLLIPTGRNQQVAGFAPNAWLRIDPDDSVRVVVDRSEMGQGVTTALPMLLAEELEADWTKVQIEFAPADKAYINPLFGMQGTGGSTSVRAAWTPLRKAGAAAREMLLSAAAETWSVDKSTCRAEKGAVIHTPSNRRLTYGKLVAKAATVPLPHDVPLKDPKDWKILGTRVKRLD